MKKKQKTLLVYAGVAIILVTGAVWVYNEPFQNKQSFSANKQSFSANKQSFSANKQSFSANNASDPFIKPEFQAEVSKTEAQWKEILSPQQYYVLRQKGTDIPFSETELLNEHRKGTFVTADCNEPVFRSETKFDSGTGWPSFYQPIEGSVVEITDNSLGVPRIEIVGKKCGGHLGHVFNDGPEPTGLRYCINSSALKFIPD